MGWRIVATLVLLVVSLSAMAVGALEISKELVVGTVAGLLVLATAGIWVSFFAEREAQRTVLATAEGIRQASNLSRSCAEASLMHFFPSSDDEDYHHFSARRLSGAHQGSNIRVMGIACQGFFHPDRGPHNNRIRFLARRGVPMRILLLHPLSEPGVSRGLREDRTRNLFGQYSNSILVSDVLRSCEGIIGLNSPVITARLCPVSLFCKAVFLDDVLIFEPHHFGSDNQRASIETPILVYRSSSRFAARLADHFEFLWELSESFPVTQRLIENIRGKSSKMNEQGWLFEYMKVVRSDLFGERE